MIQIHDKVAFSKQWLRNTGQYIGELSYARGEVTELITLGSELIIAVITWDRDHIPTRVNTKNLILVKQIPYED